MTKAASRQRRLPRRTPTTPPTPDAGAIATAEAAQDAADVQKVQDRIASDKAKDKIGQVDQIDHAPFNIDQAPTQCFGQKVIDDCDGDVDLIPRWRFSRYYFGLKVVVDLFRTEQAYNLANVAERRKFCEKYGARYVAMGPNHSRHPHADKDMRRRFPSMVEQLERKG